MRPTDPTTQARTTGVHARHNPRPLLLTSCAAAALSLGLRASAAAPAADAGARTDGSAAVPYYVPTYSTKDPPKPLRWMRSNCVLLRAASGGSADVPDDSELEALARAAANWSEATQGCSYLRLKVLEPRADAKPGFDRRGPNESVVSWIEDDWRALKVGDGPAPSGATAITLIFFNDVPTSADYGRIYDADIYLNGQHFTFSTGGERGLTDVENVLTHELGHVMGLDHTCDDGQRRPLPLDNLGQPIPSCSSGNLGAAVTEATMFPNAATGESKKRTPEAGDVHGVCQTYPLADDPKRCEAVDFRPQGGCALGPGPALAPAPSLAGSTATRTTLSLLLVSASLALLQLRRGRLGRRRRRS